MKEPTQERSRHSAEQVLEATLRLMRSGGIAAVTTARVAEESGISNGSIYHRFGSRRSLLTAALDQFIAQLQDQVRQLRAAVPVLPTGTRERVHVLVRVYQAIFQTHGPLIRAFFIDSLDEPELAARGEAGKAMFAEQVADFLSPVHGEAVGQDRSHTFLMVHRLLFGYFTMRMLFHEGIDNEPSLLALEGAVLGVLAVRP